MERGRAWRLVGAGCGAVAGGVVALALMRFAPGAWGPVGIVLGVGVVVGSLVGFLVGPQVGEFAVVG